jgi:hypothetical protein
MTKIIDEVVQRVKKWPEWRQEDAAQLLEMLEESGTDIYRLSDEERIAVRQGLASRIVSDEELKAFRSRYKA